MALFLHNGGNLQSFINNYRCNEATYITNSIYDTLMMNLVYLRMGSSATELNRILEKRLNENQLVALLSAELRNRSEGKPTYKDIGTFQLNMDRETRYDLDKYLDEWRSAYEKIIYGELAGSIDIFTETKERLLNDNPWLYMAERIKDDEYVKVEDYVNSQDKEVVEKFMAVEDKEEYKLQLSMIPKPFLGNPLNAEVVILTLNPGYNAKYDVEEYDNCTPEQQKRFIETKCRIMLLQDNRCIQDGDNEYMNQLEANYWKQMLKDVLALPEANKKIAIVQFLGYSSVAYKDIPQRFFDNDKTLLPTQEYTIRLVRYLMQQGKVIVITRAKNKWYDHIPELKYYKKKVLLNNIRQTYITENNCQDNGFELIKTALKNN